MKRLSLLLVLSLVIFSVVSLYYKIIVLEEFEVIENQEEELETYE